MKVGDSTLVKYATKVRKPKQSRIYMVVGFTYKGVVILERILSVIGGTEIIYVTREELTKWNIA